MDLHACVFETPLGWFGIVGEDRTVWRVTIGHRFSKDAWANLRSQFRNETLIESNWHPVLKKKLEDFANGKPVSFDNIAVHADHHTQFQEKVLIATRALSFGETATYGELAARVGSPRAARAVGSVMASNSVPIIIPCHRVVGSAGGLGGFSAPRGVALKRQMLEMESHAVVKS